MVATRILIIVGTRPEVIKMAPVVRALWEEPARFEVRLCAVAQQTRLLDEALREWGLVPDTRVAPQRSAGRPGAMLDGLIDPLGKVIRAANPDLVLVHGDTTTTLAGALAAFYGGYPVGHVEAGLRSGDPLNPFPEEIHRTLVDRLANVLYAPTPAAREHLLREGRDPAEIVVVGNTVLDALDCVSLPPRPEGPGPWEGRRVILVTGHRRESFGAGHEGVCRALRRLVMEREDIHVVYVLHPHPAAHGPSLRLLDGLPRVDLLQPLAYREFVELMRRSYLIVTDSGGIQEEAPSLGKPVLVTRKCTERPEALQAGVAELVGVEPAAIVRAVGRLLDDPRAHARMARRAAPFGMQGAARRIRDDLGARCRHLCAS